MPVALAPGAACPFQGASLKACVFQLPGCRGGASDAVGSQGDRGLFDVENIISLREYAGQLAAPEVLSDIAVRLDVVVPAGLAEILLKAMSDFYDKKRNMSV